MGVWNHHVRLQSRISSKCLTLSSSLNSSSYIYNLSCSHERLKRYSTGTFSTNGCQSDLKVSHLRRPLPQCYLGQCPKKVVRRATWVSSHGVIQYLPIYSPYIVKRQLLCYHPCWVFLLDDSVCSLFWLSLVTVCSVLCESRAASPLTVMAEHCRVEKPLQPAYIYTYLFSNNIKKTHLRRFSLNKTRPNCASSKITLVRLNRCCSSSLFKQQ